MRVGCYGKNPSWGVWIFSGTTQYIIIANVSVLIHPPLGKRKILSNAYLPTFGNQKSGHFQHCFNPTTPQFLQTKASHQTPWAHWRGCIALCSEFHEPFICTVDKGNFFSVRRKKTWKILIYVLNIILKTGIFNRWNSRKSGHPNFWRFWK